MIHDASVAPMARVRVGSAPRRTGALRTVQAQELARRTAGPTRAPLVGTIGRSLELVFTAVVADREALDPAGGGGPILRQRASAGRGGGRRGRLQPLCQQNAWGYYTRPAISDPKPVTVAEVKVLIDRCEERGVDLAIEWVHEIHPELAGLAATVGLEVTHHALMVVTSGMPIRAAAIEGNVRFVSAEDPAFGSRWCFLRCGWYRDWASRSG